MNHVILVGKCASMPAYKQIKSGGSMCSFYVETVQQTRKGQNVDLIEVSAFGDLHNLILDTVVKGMDVIVSGKLKSREYNGKHYISVWADAVQSFQARAGEQDIRDTKQETSLFEDEIPF